MEVKSPSFVIVEVLIVKVLQRPEIQQLLFTLVSFLANEKRPFGHLTGIKLAVILLKARLGLKGLYLREILLNYI